MNQNKEKTYCVKGVSAILIVERHQNIVDSVIEKGSVRVSELSELFGITEETVRRDLEKLEQAGKLVRTHGGAVAIQEVDRDLPQLKRETLHVAEKEKIARIALQHIHENDSILIDGSSTAFYLAKVLPNMSLTVITNSIRVIMELASKNKIHVICTGGIYSDSALSFLGPLTVQSLANYHADKAFISCKALDVSWGISESNDMQAMVKQKMLDIATHNYLLIDHSKVGSKATTNVASLNNIDYLITDEQPDDRFMDDIHEYGVQVITS